MYKYIEHGSVYSQYTKHNIDGYRENLRDTAANLEMNRIEVNHMLGVCVCSMKIFVSTIQYTWHYGGKMVGFGEHECETE